MNKKLISLSVENYASSLIESLEIFYKNSSQGRITAENFENLTVLNDHLVSHDTSPQKITLDLRGFPKNDLVQALLVVKLLLPLSKDNSLEKYMQEKSIVCGHITKFIDKITCKNDLFEFLKSFCIENIREDIRKQYFQMIKFNYSFQSEQASEVLQKLEYILAIGSQCSLEKIFEDCIRIGDFAFIAMDYLKKRNIDFKRLSYCQDVADEQWQQRKSAFLREVEEKDCLVRIQGETVVDFIVPTAMEVQKANDNRRLAKIQQEKKLAEKREIIKKCCQQNNLKYRQEYQYQHNIVLEDIDDQQWFAKKNDFIISCQNYDIQGIIVRVQNAKITDYFENIIPGRDQKNEKEWEWAYKKLTSILNKPR